MKNTKSKMQGLVDEGKNPTRIGILISHIVGETWEL